MKEIDEYNFIVKEWEQGDYRQIPVRINGETCSLYKIVIENMYVNGFMVPVDVPMFSEKEPVKTRCSKLQQEETIYSLLKEKFPPMPDLVQQKDFEFSVNFREVDSIGKGIKWFVQENREKVVREKNYERLYWIKKYLDGFLDLNSTFVTSGGRDSESLRKEFEQEKQFVENLMRVQRW